MKSICELIKDNYKIQLELNEDGDIQIRMVKGNRFIETGIQASLIQNDDKLLKELNECKESIDERLGI